MLNFNYKTMKKNPNLRGIGLKIHFLKIFLVMKLTFFLVCWIVISTQASVNAQRQTVTLKVQDVSLAEAIRELQQQTHLDFFFSNKKVDVNQKVTLDVYQAKLEEVLKQIFGTGFQFEFMDDMVIIGPARNSSVLPQQKEIVVEGRVTDIHGEGLPGVSVTLKGTTIGVATDEEGYYKIGLPEIKDIILVYSFVGMDKKEVKYAGQKIQDVVMTEQDSHLDEVVVTGYQVIDKRSLTSSISTIKADQLEKMGVLTVDQMLEGKTPGLMITNLTTTPGAAAKIRVRAGGTFTGTREPLWVIDGVIYEDPVPLSASEINSFDNISLIGNAITGLNPQDIEQIDVLKDASATAIYGTRAANGVIVITTKRGKTGASSVSYSGSLNIVDRPHYSDFDLMNSKERIDVSREIHDRGLGYPSDNMLYTPLAYEKALSVFWKDGNFNRFQNEVSRLEKLNYDWFKKLYRPAVNQTHSVNISGGSDKIRYYFSIGYDNQLGTEKGVSLDRLTTRTNIDVDLRKNVLLSFGVDGSVQKAKYNHSSINMFNEAYYTSRAVEATDENGDPIYTDRLIRDNGYYITPRLEFGRYNVLNEQQNSSRRITNKAYNFKVNLDWTIIRGIKFSSRFSYRNTTNINEEWIKENTYYIANLRGYDEFRDNIDDLLLKKYSLVPFGGIYSGGQTSQEAMSIRNQLNLIKTLNEKHVFNLNLAQEASSTVYKGADNWEAPGYNHEQGRSFIRLTDFFSSSGQTSGIEDFLYQSMAKWFTTQARPHSIYPTITDRTTNIMSWIGIFTYSFADRYVANFNLRSDGSNTFGQYERYKFRPAWSASARWNIHNENFMKKLPAIDELALRVSFGFRGTSPNATPYLTITNYGRNAFFSPENTAKVQSYPNANLRWEKSQTLNTGLNFSFFGNRLSGALDYAYSRNTDLLLTRPVSLVNGITQQLYNGGSKDDHTYEMDLRAEVIKTKSVRWNVNFNLTRVKEKIIKGTNVIPGQIQMSDYLNGTIMMKGFPVDGFFSYRFGGLDKQGMPQFPELFETYSTEYEKLQKVLVYEGNRLPKVYGGFGTEIGFKGFVLSANFTYKAGQKVRLLELYKDGQQMPLSGDNMRGEFASRWRQKRDENLTSIPALSTDPLLIYGEGGLTGKVVGSEFLPNGGYSSSLWKVYDLSNVRTAKGDFIRWQSLTLSYRCPEKFLKTIGFKSLLVRFQVQNVCVWTFDKKLKGQDPEQVKNIGIPALPSYNIGLNFSF